MQISKRKLSKRLNETITQNCLSKSLYTEGYIAALGEVLSGAYSFDKKKRPSDFLEKTNLKLFDESGVLHAN